MVPRAEPIDDPYYDLVTCFVGNWDNFKFAFNAMGSEIFLMHTETNNIS